MRPPAQVGARLVHALDAMRAWATVQPRARREAAPGSDGRRAVTVEEVPLRDRIAYQLSACRPDGLTDDEQWDPAAPTPIPTLVAQNTSDFYPTPDAADAHDHAAPTPREAVARAAPAQVEVEQPAAHLLAHVLERERPPGSRVEEEHLAHLRARKRRPGPAVERRATGRVPGRKVHSDSGEYRVAIFGANQRRQQVQFFDV